MGTDAPRRGRRLLLLVALVVLAIAAALHMGPVRTDPGTVLRALVDPIPGEMAHEVVRRDRLPPVILGLLVGAGLALAGAIFQALLRNDLAEPYLIGVGPGALLGVTLAVASGAAWRELPAARGAAAFVGCVAVAALVFAAARRRGVFGAAALVLSGVAIGAFVSAIATGVLYVAADDWRLVVLWLLGHLSPADGWEILWMGGALVGAGAIAWTHARELDALTFGDDPAGLLGVDVSRAVVLLGAAGCLLAAAAVAVSGLIGFVGLVVPHLARGWVGPGHRLLLPASALMGGALLVLADGGARMIHPPVPVGVVTAVLGAPFLAWLVRRGEARGV